jgi:hypothetical protein
MTSIVKSPVLPVARMAFVSNLVERSELKFSDCLTAELLVEVVASRSLDEENLSRLASKQ